MEKYTNDLIHESSPYLLQHAHNPVNWISWSDDIYERAEKENKMLLISIGYSSCHWCHVMEHECFEDEEVAALMNKFFINVKVDREERPDVDQIYMSAVQLMTQKGGWPLNCFTLPNGKPIYGGTYFPKEQWMQILKSLNHAFVNETEKVLEYSEKLQKGIAASELISTAKSGVIFEETILHELVQRWTKSFDLVNGGTNRAPKFPLPNNYEFLLDYAVLSGNENVKSFVDLTLNKMAFGGIYDQVGGGFSRYSVDVLWKVPHFEKMLYDNGQMISLYSKAYRKDQSPLYKRVVYQTIEWLRREMLDESGGFYAALDADSEGVEGKFYVWNDEELKIVFGEKIEFANSLYEFNQNGKWEGNYIPLRSKSDEQLKKEFKLSQLDLEKEITHVNETLLNHRKDRVRPGLDDKCLTGWNGIMLKGLCDAYSTFKEDEFLLLATKCANWIDNQQIKEGGIYRTYKNGESKIEGFLEEYAHVVSGFISFYSITNDETWLHKSNELMELCIDRFHDKESGMFFFTESDSKLIARKMELSDNVIPASNSVMAHNLFLLSKFFNRTDYQSISKQMLANVYDGMEMYGSGYSNWAMLLNYHLYGYYEIVIVGHQAEQYAEKIYSFNFPNLLVVHSNGTSNLPVFDTKTSNDSTLIYVCSEGTCHAPLTSIDEVIKVIQG